MSDEIEKAEEVGDLRELIRLVKENLDTEEDVLEEALSATYRLATSLSSIDLDGDDVTFAADVLFNCFERWMEEAYLIEIVLSIVKCFANKSVSLREQLSSSTTLKMVVECMNTHADGEETVQEQGCLAVEALAQGSLDARSVLNSYGAAEAVERAAGLITNERNKKYAVQAKTALAGPASA